MALEQMQSNRYLIRLGSIFAIIGGLVTIVFFFLRPRTPIYRGSAAPTLDVFAANGFQFEVHTWGVSLGFIAVLLGFVGISEQLKLNQRSDAWARLGLVVMSLATVLALINTVIDGTVLVELAGRWAGTTGAERTSLGSAGELALLMNFVVLSRVVFLFELSIGLFGLSVLASDQYPRWLGVLGVGIGVLGVLAGGLMVVQGAPTMVAQLGLFVTVVLALLWVSVVGWSTWQL